MKALGRYDTALQMFVEEQPREPDMNHLAFLRFLVEHNRLEHQTAGSPVGEYAPIIGTVLTCAFCELTSAPLLPGQEWECPNDGITYTRLEQVTRAC